MVIKLLVGATLSDSNELKYLYENHEEFAVLPTFFILPALQVILVNSVLSMAVPGKQVNFAQALHGEQYIEVCNVIRVNNGWETGVFVIDIRRCTGGRTINAKNGTCRGVGQRFRSCYSDKR